MNDKIKMLALDLDGTTLRSDTTLSVNVQNALKKALKHNIEVVAASGRPYGSMPDYVLGIDGINYAITSNGAAVYDKNGKRIKSYLLDEKDVLEFLDITAPYDIIFEAFIDGNTFSDARYVNNPVKYGCSQAYIDYVQSSRGHIDDMRKFIFEHRHELDSLEYVCINKNMRENIRREIADNINGFFITSSSENFVEFSAKQATKANATEFVSSLLDIKQSGVASCGNADNDADMIKWAGLGSAVKNASAVCLDAADLVVASNDNDGVAELIDYIFKHNSECN